MLFRLKQNRCWAGVLYAASLWLANTSYLYLAVSFIQMTKSLMPGLVYFSGCFAGTEKYSFPYMMNMMLIAFGVVICAFGELNLNVRGLMVQLIALGFEATRLTLVQVSTCPVLPFEPKYRSGHPEFFLFSLSK